MSDSAVTSVSELRQRLLRLAAAVGPSTADAVLITPGADMQYLLGHSVPSHERLTCLIVPSEGDAQLLVPALERAGWNGSPAEALGLRITTWADGDDCYAAAAGLFPRGARTLSVDPHMPAAHALQMADAVRDSRLTLAGDVLGDLRARKSAEEVTALREVGAAIDRVHRRIGEWLRPGRTENEVAADIAAAIVAEGHARADFVIVGSGPNGASPHHEASDRVIGSGELVVIDIGGPAADGYNSDCTRTYLTPGEADPEALAVYEIVRRAQSAAVAAVRPGVTCEEIDAVARRIIVEEGYGEYFITRTGHGIGLEVHEEPYIVAGNTRQLEPGMAFSVEPGIYLPGRFGVRIEDIVVVTESGVVRCNTTPTDLVVMGS